MKRYAPATARNRGPIAEVLAQELPESGVVTEIASGSGEHAAHFAGAFPRLEWQPSDADPSALASIEVWREEAGLANLRAPLTIDAAGDWPVANVAAVVCINMVHISPVMSAHGLMTNAGRVLGPHGPLVIYGPFLEAEVATAQSNLDFDADLKARDPRWGLREVEWLDSLAVNAGLVRTRRIAMPANNLILVFRRT